MSEVFLLAQLSDPHIGAEWADGDPVAGLAAAVESVASMRRQPDAVLVSGDLADNATDAGYEQVRELLAPLQAPLYVLPGAGAGAACPAGEQLRPRWFGRRCGFMRRTRQWAWCSVVSSRRRASAICSKDATSTQPRSATATVHLVTAVSEAVR
jgi:hypothetical protein